MTRVNDGMQHPSTATLVSHLHRDTRRTALRNLTGTDGADLDVAVALGLTTEHGVTLLRQALSPAATPRNPAGCAACGRASGRGCAVCRQAWQGWT